MKRPNSIVDHLPGALYSAEQVRKLDQAVMAAEGIRSFELMARAGEAAFACLLGRWGSTESVCVIAGAGNNGGDGYVLAALAALHGMDVHLYTLGDHDQLSEASTEARQMALDAGVLPRAFEGELDFDGELIVDALLGIGLNTTVAGLYADVIWAVNGHPADVLALDIPSGLDADTGGVMGVAVYAAMTVTFIGVKRGLLVADGPDLCGEIAFAALSTESDSSGRLVPDCERISWHRLRQLSQLLPLRSGNTHKGQFGHVLVIGGNLGMAGAVIMASEAAGRSGAGLVSCATRPEHGVAVLARRPEVMVHGVVSGLELASLLDSASVLAVGPGMGQGSWAELMLQQALKSEKPLVLDADGLNLLATPAWFHEFSQRNVVLTPHPGEAARLLGMDTLHVQQNRFAAARALAEKYQAVVVLKGRGTLVAHPDGRVAVCTDGNPGMATGGMGDVLTGVVAALIAQGCDAWQAARLGVCLHSAAADLAAEEGGSRGLLASDLFPYLRALNNDS
ncbi:MULTISPECIES: NAD(P)H-hydrate dehydratase [unclassified Oceanobacter]|uniref:NAD(P)H-hydrate dehydratase n=1 Tax=unclassified Oceanobacter TaxID=2620260 RepID=UPI0026E1B70A|nr:MULTISPECIES: NAD(P)H-hydrate dehydratase [unclassified Oceanobacter]MDO6682395.1 NAD(P)H-hydrate dehydratase [Oceanobacter sp. 5_MG-2023]MDP2505963.1 NAD(P)H-hydrate dehydratase [Oceanobacter sp. 3_MG-2023]MDP2547548.1 NAD(P)H-hydrate dehydratase [Oceanobacter sp. 4_MG-2023]MDP2608922.1 NAD(P)H-hydrate dehydratase [Oceanobacter sp. 1_MG-2023]MDP2612093.1 NAD(P)H-hydrate dehydratase [Oceanobacter sp. 2_MG-2023]